MAVPFRSIDDALANDAAQGSLTRFFYLAGPAATTAATSTSGFTSMQRLGATFAVPTFTGNAYMTYFRAYYNRAGQPVVAAIEVDLGSINMSSGTFTDGSAMPTRTIGGGASAALATVLPMLYVSSAVTATTPTVTVTYANQAGTGSHTAAPVLPTNAAVNSAFFLQPHLQSGDTGIRDVTNVTKSAGSAGTIHVVGLIPLAIAVPAVSQITGEYDVLAAPMEMYPIVSGDVIAFYTGAAALANLPFACAFQLQAEV